MARVVVTGASGSIGGKIVPALAARGHELTLLDARPAPGTSIADLSVWDEAWASKFEGADCVVHLAAAARPDAPPEVIQALNLDLTLNVFEAAVRARVARVVFASSNWIMAGHRFDNASLTADAAPAPLNGYGFSKLAGERIGRSFSERHGLSVVCLRIGYCQHAAGNRPGPHMAWGLWGQQMWLSDTDLVAGFTRAVEAPRSTGFAIVNLVSANQGMRWSLEEGRRAIGYDPVEGHTPSLDVEARDREDAVRRERAEIAEREASLMARRW